VEELLALNSGQTEFLKVVDPQRDEETSINGGLTEGCGLVSETGRIEKKTNFVDAVILGMLGRRHGTVDFRAEEGQLRADKEWAG
jgi:hypothetical protein